MALATAAVGALPSHAAIGIVAPVLLFLLRAIQGFSAGGEVATAAVFVVEHAPHGRRGSYGSWSTATLAAGVAAGLGAAALLAIAVPQSALYAGWWRLSFLLALPLGLIGVWLRVRQADTPGFRAVSEAGLIARRPVQDSLRHCQPQLVAAFAPMAAASLVFNTFFLFLPSHLATSGGIPLRQTLGTAVIGLAAAAVAAAVAGRISDTIGRRPIMVPGAIGLTALAFPMYMLAVHGSVAGLLVADIAIGLAVSAVVQPAYFSELFPTRLRATAMSLTFGLATALFGGTAPLADLFLIGRTGSEAGPAIYCTVIALFAALSVLTVGETAFRPLPENRP
ncbi:MAG: MFS transporter [Micromonosporaceae bacterium]